MQYHTHHTRTSHAHVIRWAKQYSRATPRNYTFFRTPTQSFVSSNVLLQYSRTALYCVPEVNRLFTLSAYFIQITVDIRGFLHFQLFIHTENSRYSTVSSASGLLQVENIRHSTVSLASSRNPSRKH